ncbi:uroporphyrinogen-III synthase [Haliscomenobacter hydrossis]|uniref:Uroporphyrinogen III synthase HEM4 n=1 Tax=Haliscomenobacter hydrossis (strain ATCC 27775 / DSM 1100 / LMG 10767 / O) TaxID=760192 RepID=F4KXS6_HALH1|nr:uroporphyrinogen-III synthase [Haliscomenobacter hydrossis]AEE51437.1 Uroporphyrinogen III synthase HEM4 [Haliscomenobacter hydrossis DSM 1100]
MAANGQAKEETFKKVKTILVSQPKPERSPYYELEKRYNLQIDWRPFSHVEGLEAKDFRKQRIRPDEFTAIILSSKNSVDHFFRLCEEMRVKMSPETKYFCLTETIANYLQKFILYRKRKVFVGTRSIEELGAYLKKHKGEKFLLPCSNLGAKEITKFLDDMNLDWKDAIMYHTVSSDLSDLSDVTYDVLVFFSPLCIQSLYDNFPDFKQNDTRIAVYGNLTRQAVEDRGLNVNINAPAPEVPSMTKALENYLQKSNKDI